MGKIREYCVLMIHVRGARGGGREGVLCVRIGISYYEFSLMFQVVWLCLVLGIVYTIYIFI